MQQRRPPCPSSPAGQQRIDDLIQPRVERGQVLVPLGGIHLPPVGLEPLDAGAELERDDGDLALVTPQCWTGRSGRSRRESGDFVEIRGVGRPGRYFGRGHPYG